MVFRRVDITIHTCYTDCGMDFEGLLAEAIRQVNLENIHKQIITSNAASREEVSQ
ncbi:hypothetical protein [Candidatus Bathycorpusculum sp.]|uniref:hypothetical protein n=1 Tax=Candidatus Bathycorpusculum sp. TaxID=2994959 RepID=UPI00282FE23A|nr:hypothetical protein [Candidatus Termitimicrobium sp.]